MSQFHHNLCSVSILIHSLMVYAYIDFASMHAIDQGKFLHI
jgi:hypothetical protein